MNCRQLFLFAALSATALATPPAHEPKMSWLDNGVIRLGVDLELGGAITWLSRSGDQVNLINSNDWGRQVQMSFYGGPVPYSVGEKQPRADWAGLGWNPIQSGDTYGHRSKVLEQRNDGARLYVKCIPMQWPLDDVPAECTMESWLELDGSAVRARGRLVNARADRTAYSAHLQELPAVYTNAPWHRIFTYSGARPFTGEAVREIAAQPPPKWSRWTTTENWSALLDDSGWGLGVWNPGAFEFGGGFNGRPGAGGARDPECGYLAPNRAEILDHDIDYTFQYELILGTLEQIRARVYAHAREAQVDRLGLHERPPKLALPQRHGLRLARRRSVRGANGRPPIPRSKAPSFSAAPRSAARCSSKPRSPLRKRARASTGARSRRPVSMKRTPSRSPSRATESCGPTR